MFCTRSEEVLYSEVQWYTKDEDASRGVGRTYKGCQVLPEGRRMRQKACMRVYPGRGEHGEVTLSMYHRLRDYVS